MAHEYSVAIHQYIAHKISSIKAKESTAKKQNDIESYEFYRGQLQELFKIREYLTDRIDLRTQKYY
jgi:hypothetical protein